MKLKGQVISDINKMGAVQDLWDKWVKENSNNPFLYTGYQNQLFHEYKVNPPSNLLFLANDKVVGLYPSGIKTMGFLYRYCTFALGIDFERDFNFGENKAEILKFMVNIAFEQMNCSFLDLVLPSDSENIKILETISKDLGLNFSTAPEKGHSVLHVKSSWAEFEKIRGRNLRKMINKTERQLTALGAWKIEILGKEQDGSKIFQRILEVEKESWKDQFYKKHKMPMDRNLLFIWKGTQKVSLFDPNYDWKVAFLELNGKTIAYSIFTQFKESAFVIKTSFSDQYRKLYPGIYINHVVLRELFDRQTVKEIDFLTDLDFHRKWTSPPPARTRVMLDKGGLDHYFGKKVLFRIINALNTLSYYLRIR